MKNKTLLITGASGNLGSAVAKKFLDEGYTVIAGVQKGHKIPSHKNSESLEVNLLDEQSAANFVNQAAAKLKKIETAVFLVGGFSMGTIAETDKKALDKMYKLNFETAYFCARPLLQHMKKNKYGRIVLIGARPGLQNELGKDMAAYTLSKSLIFSLANILNADASSNNVVTSVIVPSIIDTPQNRSAMPDTDFAQWVTPESLADVIFFTASKAAKDLRKPVFHVYGNS
jgi:NAD(P)-dependent dehydrogenase (short-subunit alcohol dehydrogenase family)